jgi:hypothetical protein
LFARQRYLSLFIHLINFQGEVVLGLFEKIRAMGSVMERLTAIMRGFPASTCTHPLKTSHFPSKAAKK